MKHLFIFHLAVLTALAQILLFSGCNNSEPEKTLLGISLNKSELELPVGDSYRLNVLFEPEDIDENMLPDIIWESSRSLVAKVDDNGRVTAMAVGTATISATCGKLYAECKVIVHKAEPMQIAVSPTTINAPAEGGTYSLAVTTSVEWTAVVSDSWISLDKTKGLGNSNLTLTVAPNADFAVTNGKITFKAGDAESVVEVHREGRTPQMLAITPSEINAPAEGGDYKLKVLSAIAWSASVSEPWATVSPSSGEGDAEITVTLQQNTTLYSKTQQIEFTNGEKKESLTVTLAGRAPLPITIDKNTLDVPAAGGTYTIYVTSSIDWAVNCSATWVNVTQNAKSATITVAPYSDSRADTSAEVLFSNGESYVALTITQQKPILSLSLYAINATEDGGKYTIDVTSNGSWTVESNVDWITLSRTTGTGNGSFDATIKPTDSQSNTTGSIYVRYAGITNTISVNRAGYKVGLFTVGKVLDKPTKVKFSSGNLMYRASTATWQFAPNEYTVIGENNKSISSSNTLWIDLFGFATSGYNSYYPYNSSTTASDYYSAGTGSIAGTNYDWGQYNSSKITGNTDGTKWRVLEGDEWQYLIENHVHFMATVNGICGVIILPDYYDKSIISVSSTTGSYLSHVYTSAQYQKMHNAGAIFLAAAGQRNGTTVSKVNEAGYYWSASTSSKSYAWAVSFSGSVSTNTFSLTQGMSVRLVTDAE